MSKEGEGSCNCGRNFQVSEIIHRQRVKFIMNAPMTGKPTGPSGMRLPSLSTRRHAKKIRAKVYVAAKIMKASKTRN